MQRFGQGSPYLRIKGILTTPEGKAAWNVMQKFPASDVHMYLFGPDGIYQNGFQPGNYFDSAGTTLASVDGSVGLVLDAAGSVGADLLNGAGGFDSPVGWATQAGWSITGGQLVASNVAQFSNTQRSLTLVQGKTYRVSLTCTSTTGGTYYIVRPDTTNGPNWTGVGTNSFIYTHGAAASNLYVATSTAGFTGSFDNLVVQEITGIHATQSTPGYKPTLRKGIVNLLTYSNDLTNAVWSKSAVAVTLAGENTPLNSTGQLLTSSGAFAATYPAVAIPAVSGQVVTMAFEVKAGTGASTASLVDESQGGTCYSQVTLATGATGATGFVTSATSVDLGNGWWLTTATYTVQAGKTSVTPKCWVGAYSGVSTAGQSIKVGRVALFQGTLTAAQILAAGGIPLTTTAPASSQAGVNYLEFDGIDDRLRLPSLGITDTCTFVFAITPRAFDTRVIFSSDTGGPQLYLTTGGWLTFDKVDVGTLYSLNASLQLDVPVVMSVRLSGGVVTIRKNGVVIGTTTSALTFTSTANHSIGAQAAGAFAYKGLLHQLEPLRFAVNDADLLVLEKFVAQLSGVTL